MDKDNVTPGGGKEVKRPQYEERRRARVIQCYKEQRNKSLQSNVMSRCNSYKLINENIVIK